MTTWPKDTTAAKMKFYGNFDSKGWASANLTVVVPPFQMYYEKKPIKGVTCHRKIAEALMAAFVDIWNACGHDQKKVDQTGASDYGGCFNIRRIAGSDNWSNHSWACAIDLAPGTNGFNMKGTLPALVVSAFKKQGARWGGDYKGRKDPMHFEFVSPA